MFLGRSGGQLRSAKISIREPRKDSTGQLYIPIYYDFPIGGWPSLDENSALVKPFRNILKGGKPPDGISFVFHQENENDYFVLGSFVKTIGNKILFFPGLKFSRILHTPAGRELTNHVSISYQCPCSYQPSAQCYVITSWSSNRFTSSLQSWYNTPNALQYGFEHSVFTVRTPYRHHLW
jgi:hypothetical protein